MRSRALGPCTHRDALADLLPYLRHPQDHGEYTCPSCGSPVVYELKWDVISLANLQATVTWYFESGEWKNPRIQEVSNV